MEDKLIRNGQEAIECIKNNMPSSGYEMLKESLNMAMEALGKQIPKQTEIKIHDKDVKIGHHVIFGKGTKVHYCPICHAPALGSDKYCGRCGQALIW